MSTKAIASRANKNMLMAYHPTVDANQKSRYQPEAIAFLPPAFTLEET